MQIDFWIPGRDGTVCHADHPPPAGSLITWSGVGDYIVDSVHFTMKPFDEYGCTKIMCATVALVDDPRGRQFSEWREPR